VNLLGGVRFNRYFEPFLGGGAVFFALQPSCSLLSDINADLIKTYRQVRSCPRVLEERLGTMKSDRATYDSVRAEAPSNAVDMAVRFLYLNRTGFAGIYRTNRRGEFNVPYGGGMRTAAVLSEGQLLRKASAPLRSARLRIADFEEILDTAEEGDLVYSDPTYSVVHNDNGFVRYNEPIFSWADQRRLAAAAFRARRRGATVIVSNADHSSVTELYRSSRRIRFVRMSRLCPEPSHRRLTSEAVFIIAPNRVDKELSGHSDKAPSAEHYGVTLLRKPSRVHPERWVGIGVKRSDRR
jgi:DNA adenine methylase